MTSSFRTIAIEPMAPHKPAFGAPCNGCGVCCLVQPCPIGMVLSGHRLGTCVALRWNDAAGVYRCGALAQPVEVLHAVLPRRMRGMVRPLAPLLTILARRSIALGLGCDCSLEVERPMPR